MEIHKHILLIFTILIAFWILFRLWNRYISFERPVETFKSSINMTKTNDTSLPINQYFVKASWNTAYNSYSNIMDLSMVTTVLSRGCRFIDFEIYSTTETNGMNTSTTSSITNIIPVVGYSIQPKNNYQMDCNDPVLRLIDVLTFVNDYAFS